MKPASVRRTTDCCACNFAQPARAVVGPGPVATGATLSKGCCNRTWVRAAISSTEALDKRYLNLQARAQDRCTLCQRALPRTLPTGFIRFMEVCCPGFWKQIV